MSQITSHSNGSRVATPALSEAQEGESRIYRQGSGENVVTQKERDVFNKIFKKLANDSLPYLLWTRSSIEGLQDKVSHIHPLNFMELIHYDPQLRANLKKICKSNGFVKEQCVANLKEGLGVQHDLGNLLPFANQFAGNIEVDREKAYSLLERKEFGEFVNKLENYLNTCVFS